MGTLVPLCILGVRHRERKDTGENTHSALYPYHICYSNRNGILLSCVHVYLWMHLGCMAHLILLLTSTAKLEVRTLGNSSVQISVEPLHSTAWLPPRLFIPLIVAYKVYLKRDQRSIWTCGRNSLEMKVFLVYITVSFFPYSASLNIHLSNLISAVRITNFFSLVI